MTHTQMSINVTYIQMSISWSPLPRIERLRLREMQIACILRWFVSPRRKLFAWRFHYRCFFILFIILYVFIIIIFFTDFIDAKYIYLNLLTFERSVINIQSCWITSIFKFCVTAEKTFRPDDFITDALFIHDAE